MKKMNSNDMMPSENPEIEILGDEELDEVAGGITKVEAENVRVYAKAEGREVPMPAGSCTCVHNRKYKYARKRTVKGKGINERVYYGDVRCYKCGKEWKVVDLPW